MSAAGIIPQGRRVLHLGAFQPALESALVSEVRRVRAADPLAPILVLCPTPLLCQHLARHLVTAFKEGHAGLRFLTLGALAQSLATAAMAERNLTPLPEGAGRVLWRRAVADSAASYLGPIRHLRGFPAAVRSTIRDLKEAGLTPAVAERLSQGGAPLARKLKDLVAIWRRIEEASGAAGFHDDLDLLHEAAEVAVADPPFLRGTAAFLYGFHSLDRAQRRLVTGLLQRKTVAAFLPWADDDPSGSFQVVEPLRDFLQGTLEIIPDGAPVAAKALLPFKVVAAPGDTREALEVARVASELPGRLHQTAVLLRVPRTQAPRMDLAFEDAGIPHYLPGELPLAHLPAARALRLLLQARRDDVPRKVVMELITTAPMRMSGLLGGQAGGAAPGVWDSLTREWGIVGGAAEWRTRIAAGLAELSRAVERGRDGDVEDARPGARERIDRARALSRFTDRFLEMMALIPERGRWSEIAAALQTVWGELFDFGEADQEVREAFASLSKLDALGTPVAPDLAWGTFPETVELLDDALSAPRRSEDWFEGNGVFVGDLLKARGLPFRHVILPGMVEGVFPYAAHPDPLLSDGERRHLNRSLASEDGQPFEGSAEDALLEEAGPDGPLALRGSSSPTEHFLLRVAMDAAAESLTFTLPRLDSESGRERVPSWLLLDLLERQSGQRGMTVTAFANARPVVAWLPIDPAPERRSRALTALERDLVDFREALTDGPANLARMARLLARSPFALSMLAAERNRWGERRFTVQDGWLAGNPALRPALDALAFRPGSEVSPTRLEMYATCPYKYFLHYALGLSAMEEPERQLTLSPLDRGEIIHQALERFWREEAAAKRAPIPESEIFAALERVTAVATQLLDEFARSGVTGPRILWEAAKAEIVADLRRLVELRAHGDVDWLPSAFEHGFGSAVAGSDRSPQEEAVDLGGVRLRGRIDRVDISADGKSGRVVDYKSGAARLTFKAKRGHEDEPPVFHGGEALQLPIYVLAARRRFPEVSNWQAVYDYCTRRGNFTPATLEVTPQILQSLEDLVSRMTADAGAGRFPFIAGDHCRFCDFVDVCGPAHDVAFEGKAGSPEFEPFLRRPEEFP